MPKPTLFFSQEASRSAIVPSPSSLSFASIPEALEELRHKRAIVLLNGNESDARDLLCAAEHVTPSAPRWELVFQGNRSLCNSTNA